jgi:hypothetical protein
MLKVKVGKSESWCMLQWSTPDRLVWNSVGSVTMVERGLHFQGRGSVTCPLTGYKVRGRKESGNDCKAFGLSN